MAEQTVESVRQPVVSLGCQPEVGGAGHLLQAADHLLCQCAGLIELIPDRVYATESRTIRGGTIGKHVRHVLDHYSAILTSLADQCPIDYDHRERGLSMEASREAAMEAIRETRSRIESLGSGTLAQRVRVRVMVSGDGSEVELDSTIGRELAFATHHAVHHQAMMKAMAAEFGVELSSEFGKAPSTINFERR
ncbi:MAG: hypothetical protein SFZ23_06430 [Planctomycetota bacterium]|nr:hypothetical protein [Planctomycetota bacterium]